MVLPPGDLPPRNPPSGTPAPLGGCSESLVRYPFPFALGSASAGLPLSSHHIALCSHVWGLPFTTWMRNCTWTVWFSWLITYHVLTPPPKCFNMKHTYKQHQLKNLARMTCPCSEWRPRIGLGSCIRSGPPGLEGGKGGSGCPQLSIRHPKYRFLGLQPCSIFLGKCFVSVMGKWLLDLAQRRDLVLPLLCTRQPGRSDPHKT